MRKLPVLAALGLTLALTACGGGAGVPSSPPTEPATAATPAPVPEPVVLEMGPFTEANAGARRAYAAALERVVRELVLPDGSDYSGGEYPNMEENQFAVCDVDGDGEEELILLYTTTMTAGHRGYVCSWEEETGELDIQLMDYPLFTFYESGAVQGGWSHNQGKGGSFWPYDLYRYDASLDAYVDVGSVDAWDASLISEGYPADADVSGSGFVYYIETDSSIDWEEPLDASIYEAWRYVYVRDGREIQPEYLALTEENIQRLLEE